jgi:coniferyl-aldehyde dehydrogenase
MRPERRDVAWTFKPGKAWVMYQPLGVVGIISPWNYPLLLAISPLVDALAAGNRVLLKPSELTPRFSAVLKQRLAEAFQAEEVAVVLGGVEAGEAFSRLPFDHLLFTGSTAVGRKIMAAAAEHLTPVTLELGGKSPAVVCPDYDLDRAAQAIVFGKFSNAGQTCIAPDYAMAPRQRVAALADAVIDHARRAYPAIAANPDYASIISDRHFHRLERIVREAESAGARVLRHSDADAAASRKIGPTVVVAPPDDSELMREEIFGPVLPIVPYDTLDDAVAYINARDRPLALYCFSRDAGMRERVLGGTISGDVTLNGTLLHIAQDDLPFGGVGQSGIGGYHGRDGFRRFSHPRGVFQVRGVNALGLLAPPYGKRADRVIRFLMRK